jgi:hypothetical protein
MDEKLQKIKLGLSESIESLQNSIFSLMERYEKIDKLNRMSEAISQDAQRFRRETMRMNAYYYLRLCLSYVIAFLYYTIQFFAMLMGHEFELNP